MPRKQSNTGAATRSTIEQLRDVLADQQARRFKDETGKSVVVDTFTASAIVKVYDGLSAENQERFAAYSAPQMADIAWKILHNAKARQTGVR